METPWESTPRRSVSTIISAVVSACAGDIPQARNTDTSCSRISVEGTRMAWLRGGVCSLRGRAVNGKGGRDDPVDRCAIPAPGGHVGPEALCHLAGPGIHLVLVDPRGATALDEDLAVHDDRVHVAPGPGVDQGLDGISVDGGAEMGEVDEQDVGLGAGSEAPEIVAAQELAASERGGIEDVAMLAGLIV